MEGGAPPSWQKWPFQVAPSSPPGQWHSPLVTSEQALRSAAWLGHRLKHTYLIPARWGALLPHNSFLPCLRELSFFSYYTGRGSACLSRPTHTLPRTQGNQTGEGSSVWSRAARDWLTNTEN